PTLRANPRDEVLRLVPSDASFCFLVQNLRDHAQKLQNSPFVAPLAQMQLAAGIKGTPEWEDLETFSSHLKVTSGLTVEEIRDDICGDAMALIHQSAPANQPGQDKTYILVWVKKPKALLDLVQKFHAIEGAERTELMWKGRTFWKGTKPDGKVEF